MAEQVLAEWSQVAVCTYKSAGGTKTWLQTKRGEAVCCNRSRVFW